MILVAFGSELVALSEKYSRAFPHSVTSVSPSRCVLSREGAYRRCFTKLIIPCSMESVCAFPPV